MGDPASAAAGAVAEQITVLSLKWIGRQIGYMVRCNRSIKNLKDEVERLRAVIQEVEGKVERSKNNAEVIYPVVSHWLDNAKLMNEGVEKFLEEESKLKCCNGWCPDLGWRHRLGSDASTKVVDVGKLIGEEGAKYDQVGYPAPISLISSLSSQNYQHFETRESVFDNIMEALADVDSSNCMVGICGMPGVGKTTIVEKAAELAHQRQLFDEVIRANISQNPNVRNIQDELADYLNLRFEAKSEDGRAAQLRNRLENGKRILVIMDDVWDEIDLKKIGIPFTENTRGCKILLTSRNSDVCSKMGAHKKFQIRVLSEKEALWLLREKVGDPIDSPELCKVAREVCEQCGGLPLAIVTLGMALKEKDQRVWNAILEQLKSCSESGNDQMTAKIHFSVELSFQYSLKDDEVRSCFYYCCLFPEDAQISLDDLVKYGIGTRFLRGIYTIEKAKDRVHMLVERLKASCLLEEGRDKHFVKMHDVIRDVAMSVVSRDKEYAFLVRRGVQEWPEEDKFQHCRVILLDNITELPQGLECPELRTLVLKSSGGLVQVPNDFFKGLLKLEVLELQGMHLGCPLATMLLNLVDLRVVCLDWCRVKDLTFFKESTKLEMLSFRHLNVQEASPIMGRLAHLRLLGRLTRLRLLELEVKNLRLLPSGVISSLTRLEELYIWDELEWGSEGNASIAELGSLTRLIALRVHIPSESLPLQKDLIGFEKLKRFEISVGKNNWAINYREPQRRRTLKLEGICLDDEINVLMEKSEVLCLKNVKDWNKVVHHERRYGVGFVDLEYLEFHRGCDGILNRLLGCRWNRMGADESSFGNLRVLRIFNCGLTYLFSPSIARALGQLQQLQVNGCLAMEVIISEDGNEQVDQNSITFPCLKEMNLFFLPKLKAFYASAAAANATARTLFNQKVLFPALDHFFVTALSSITAIWERQFLSIENLGSLVVLNVDSCDSMVSVIDFDKGYEMETLIFPKLKTMVLQNLKELKGFCHAHGSRKALFNHKVSFPTLDHLFVTALKSIDAIWERQFLSIENLESLVELDVDSCDSMVSVIDFNDGFEMETPIFPKLKTIVLLDLQELKGFYHTCGSREALFNHKVSFPALDFLFVRALKSINAIWEYKFLSTENLGSLVLLNVDSCDSMVSVINLDKGYEMETLIFPRLKTMVLRNLKELKGFCCIHGSREALFNHKISFPALEKWDIQDLESIATTRDSDSQSL